jgi:hypothetical protein
MITFKNIKNNMAQFLRSKEAAVALLLKKTKAKGGF